jgi:thiamine-monophosphate kinase
MKEREIITAIAENLARSARQGNVTFTSDAEILELNGCRLAVTVDDYSAEDRISDRDPVLLGWNLVTATVSDLLAVGAEPRFMLNSLVATAQMDAAYLVALATGMQQALAACGAHMAGGDVGSGAEWRFTGVALGSFRAGQVPLCRLAPRGSGAVMVTGAFGDANLAAAGDHLSPRFEIRLAESAALAALVPENRATAADAGRPRAAAACIDTSDGLVAALETLCALDAGLRIEIDMASVPLAPGVAAAASAMGVPLEVFMMGSAGEYELLALVPEAAVDGIARAGMRPIGTFATGPHGGLYFRRGADLIAHPGLPDPRDAASFDAYCATLIQLARSVFGGRGRP